MVVLEFRLEWTGSIIYLGSQSSFIPFHQISMTNEEFFRVGIEVCYIHILAFPSFRILVGRFVLYIIPTRT